MAEAHLAGPGAAPQVRVFADAAGVTEAARVLITERLRAIVAAEGAATVALSGGTTPLALYAALAAGATDPARTLPWSAITLVYGDERCVPYADARSNHGAVRRALLEPLAAVSMSPAAVVPVPTELAPDEAARVYEAQLRSIRPIDLVLLGVGADGHTASLFPGSAALAETTRAAVAVDAPALPNVPVDRVSLTLPVIQSAPIVVLLACGAEKAPALALAHGAAAEALHAFPVARARGTRETWWLLDRLAATDLPGLHER